MAKPRKGANGLPQKPRKSKLRKSDLETIMHLFGFHDIKEFSEFVDEQDRKAMMP